MRSILEARLQELQEADDKDLAMLQRPHSVFDEGFACRRHEKREQRIAEVEYLLSIFPEDK